VSHLIATGKIASLMIALTFICLEQKDSPKPKTGLVKLCAITLQLLTTHDRKELSHIVNSKVDLPVGIRAQYSVPGTLADFLIVSICSVIFSTSSQLATPSTPTHNAAHNNPQDADNGVDANFNTIYTPLVLALTNLSPFLKDLTPAASSRLSQLFLFFSSPGFLLREDGNVKLLYYVLEIFNKLSSLHLYPDVFFFF
jgi:hypothetical protein